LFANLKLRLYLLQGKLDAPKTLYLFGVNEPWARSFRNACFIKLLMGEVFYQASMVKMSLDKERKKKLEEL
jgi:hypothetical protein